MRKDEKILRTETGKVQFWNNGIMITGQLDIEEAKEMVREGKATVISSQAIEFNLSA